MEDSVLPWSKVRLTSPEWQGVHGFCRQGFMSDSTLSVSRQNKQTDMSSINKYATQTNLHQIWSVLAQTTFFFKSKQWQLVCMLIAMLRMKSTKMKTIAYYNWQCTRNQVFLSSYWCASNAWYSVRGHLKSSHFISNRKKFHKGGEGVWARFVPWLNKKKTSPADGADLTQYCEKIIIKVTKPTVDNIKNVRM